MTQPQARKLALFSLGPARQLGGRGGKGEGEGEGQKNCPKNRIFFWPKRPNCGSLGCFRLNPRTLGQNSWTHVAFTGHGSEGERGREGERRTEREKEGQRGRERERGNE